MTTWKKISKTPGRSCRTSPAVFRSTTQPQNCRLLLPGGTTSFRAVNIYTDGNGKLAFHFCDSGEYRLTKVTKANRTQAVTIPSDYAPRIPIGTTDATLTRDGDFYVLDLSQFSAAVINAAA